MKKLILLADLLDKKGLSAEADQIDAIIRKLAYKKPDEEKGVEQIKKEVYDVLKIMREDYDVAREIMKYDKDINFLRALTVYMKDPSRKIPNNLKDRFKRIRDKEIKDPRIKNLVRTLGQDFDQAEKERARGEPSKRQESPSKRRESPGEPIGRRPSYQIPEYSEEEHAEDIRDRSKYPRGKNPFTSTKEKEDWLAGITGKPALEIEPEPKRKKKARPKPALKIEPEPRPKRERKTQPKAKPTPRKAESPEYIRDTIEKLQEELDKAKDDKTKSMIRQWIGEEQEKLAA